MKQIPSEHIRQLACVENGEEGFFLEVDHEYLRGARVARTLRGEYTLPELRAIMRDMQAVQNCVKGGKLPS